MKTVTITKKDGKTKEIIGTREVEQPETFAELCDQFEEKDILKLAWSAYVIQVQRELDDRKSKPEDPMVSAFKKLSPEQKAKLLASA